METPRQRSRPQPHAAPPANDADPGPRGGCGTPEAPEPALRLELRRAFNANGNPVWYKAVSSLLNQLSLLTIALTGAAMLREHEQGTIKHLMVMPLPPLEIALSKVLAMVLVVLAAFTLSLLFLVQQALQVPVSGSVPLLLTGTAVYLAAAAISLAPWRSSHCW